MDLRARTSCLRRCAGTTRRPTCAGQVRLDQGEQGNSLSARAPVFEPCVECRHCRLRAEGVPEIVRQLRRRWVAPRGHPAGHLPAVTVLCVLPRVHIRLCQGCRSLLIGVRHPVEVDRNAGGGRKRPSRLPLLPAHNGGQDSPCRPHHGVGCYRPLPRLACLPPRWPWPCLAAAASCSLNGGGSSSSEKSCASWVCASAWGRAARGTARQASSVVVRRLVWRGTMTMELGADPVGAGLSRTQCPHIMQWTARCPHGPPHTPTCGTHSSRSSLVGSTGATCPSASCVTHSDTGLPGKGWRRARGRVA